MSPPIGLSLFFRSSTPATSTNCVLSILGRVGSCRFESVSSSTFWPSKSKSARLLRAYLAGDERPAEDLVWWRMTMARDAFRREDVHPATIAEVIGYGSLRSNAGSSGVRVTTDRERRLPQNHPAAWRLKRGWSSGSRWIDIDGLNKVSDRGFVPVYTKPRSIEAASPLI
jgi:hypothetical protein